MKAGKTIINFEQFAKWGNQNSRGETRGCVHIGRQSSDGFAQFQGFF